MDYREVLRRWCVLTGQNELTIDEAAKVLELVKKYGEYEESRKERERRQTPQGIS